MSIRFDEQNLTNATEQPTVMGQQNYEELDFIGSGAYGTVFRARDRDNNRTVALKRVKIAKTEEGVPVATIREISMLKLLDQNAHPNVVR